MSETPVKTVNTERAITLSSGWPLLFLAIAGFVAVVASGVSAIVYLVHDGTPAVGVSWFFASILSLGALIISCFGFFALQPNQARVLVLFGSYKGTVRRSGFYWGNPFYSNGKVIVVKTAENKESDSGAKHRSLSRNKISLRTRNFNCDKIKVNDLRGNPIEIAAVVVWRVEDTAQAMFDVDNYRDYVHIQSESALRHIAGRYPYDHGGDQDEDQSEVTLRSNFEEVSHDLQKELHARLEKAGVEIEEARLTHLAYSPEIAGAMLRRQQAEAIIAARRKIVDGAVGMVDMAIKGLSDKEVVQLDDERRASMVSNLMVVLCGESEVHPVVNTGTLYN